MFDILLKIATWLTVGALKEDGEGKKGKWEEESWLQFGGGHSEISDSFRHWNFLICSKTMGDMAIFVEGYNHKKCLKLSFPEKTSFLKILLLYPSTKMAI